MRTGSMTGRGNGRQPRNLPTFILSSPTSLSGEVAIGAQKPEKKSCACEEDRVMPAQFAGSCLY